MKQCIPMLYAEYGRYIDALRAIPYYKDCLKPVERRLIYTLHKSGSKKFAKAIRIVGACVGCYHPHGDLSTYEALVQLVTIRNFAIGQGNWGYINLGPLEAAKLRYPEVKINPDTDALFSEFIKYTPYFDPENLGELQPEFLSCPVPLGLIGCSLIMGVSFHSTKIPRYKFSDLIARLIWLLKKDAGIIEKVRTIVPAIRGCNVYESEPDTFENILTTGKGTITIIPKMIVKKDHIQILGKPPMGLSKLLTREEKDDYYHIEQSNAKNFNIEIYPNKKKNFNQAFVDMIYNYITSNININCNIVKEDQTVSCMSIDQMLIGAYNDWVAVFKLKLLSDQTKLSNKIHTLKTIELIRKIITDNNINIKKVDDIIQIFKTQYQKNNTTITIDDITQTCSKSSIKQLIEHKLNITDVQKELQIVDDKLINLATEALNKMMTYKF